MTNKELYHHLTNFNLEDLSIASLKRKTNLEYFEADGNRVPKFINEFWTSKQRQNNPIHEVSYRACFKAELPRFFISLLTKEKDVVYDPFAGRGTTIVEAALLNRNVVANDINPLSTVFSKPRLFIPSNEEVEERLEKIKFKNGLKANINLSMFYHPETESLRNYLIKRKKNEEEDFVDEWIRMIATNRLTGHSKNFFSVYTLPPNQAVTPERQKRINKKRQQKPVYKDVRFIILKKTRDLTSQLNANLVRRLKVIGTRAKFFNEDARTTSVIKSNSVQLTITSPPFLNIVNYAEDNWLRCWFNNIDARRVAQNITVTKKLDEWEKVMGEVFVELYRITKTGGYVAFEVGEVRRGKIKLDEHIVPLGIKAGFECIGIVINQQKFTKTANIWGINNNVFGTNTNRIEVFRKA
ncbi:MAG: DNA adenine methylase [Ignavibacteriaceae bacterium]|nr:DNA adenine methylase [Ignavibacteriaceae bacterium]